MKVQEFNLRVRNILVKLFAWGLFGKLLYIVYVAGGIMYGTYRYICDRKQWISYSIYLQGRNWTHKPNTSTETNYYANSIVDRLSNDKCD